MPCPVGGAPQMCKQELEELMFPCVGCSKASSGLFRDIKSIPWHPSCHFSLSRDWLQVSTEQTWESCCHCRVHVHVQNVLEQGAGSSPAPVSASRSPLKSPFRAGAQGNSTPSTSAFLFRQQQMLRWTPANSLCLHCRNRSDSELLGKQRPEICQPSPPDLWPWKSQVTAGPFWSWSLLCHGGGSKSTQMACACI
ncbi:uncharacterized protein LOC115609249 isoform X1 [Strigops habroptila]|uniref:uncharacterized protein LOC115609249 isoform X1 n=1 Tax=Strigops habroptila TaxID=2489341 RepID=UPI0011CF9558|nr:uncharacterized protein LOC115609249 isoform X1 [Strigops habroptila]